MIKSHLHYLTVNLLNNSVEFSSNLDKPVPSMSGIRTDLFTQSFRLLNGSTGRGAGLEYSRLVQGKGSKPLKVLIKESKVIYQKYKSAKFGVVSYCH